MDFDYYCNLANIGKCRPAYSVLTAPAANHCSIVGCKATYTKLLPALRSNWIFTLSSKALE